MKTMRRRSFLKVSASAGLASAIPHLPSERYPGEEVEDRKSADKSISSTLDPFVRAAKHPIVCDKPAVNFFEGALLGNGGLGCVITTRPDAIVIHFGHNDVWDIRIAENHKDEIRTFKEIFERVKAIPESLRSLDEDPWYKRYSELMQENYRKPYPRPFPCGSVLLGFDRRKVELLGHRLDISTALCEVFLRAGEKPVRLQLFVETGADRLWLRTVCDADKPCSAPFDRIHLIPDPETPREFPRFTTPDTLPEGELSFRQVLPAQEPHLYNKESGHPDDRYFRLMVQVNGQTRRQSRRNLSGQEEVMEPLERSLNSTTAFLACAQLGHGRVKDIAAAAGALPPPSTETYSRARAESVSSWKSYWKKSGVALQDAFLERIWYWNLYFLNCSVNPRVACPGLFANWSYRNIGTAWHGDYHMNYNTQQPFWVTFSSNHVDKHLPYVDLVHFLLPISRKWAKEYYGLRGAYFPHSAYPVAMSIMPYPVPTWGWEICETPWSVQSLWWHYLYTMDQKFLEKRAFGPIKEAVMFLVDYMRRPEAHGSQWKDDKYHIFPTVPPELYGLTPGFKKNSDCLVDLTLTKFVFRAYLKACEVLKCEKEESELMSSVRDVLNHFPEYPVAQSKIGQVFVSVSGEDPETVYNVPNSVMTVFPGEDCGLDSSPGEFEIASNSYRNHLNEGGNDLVFLNLQGARLGLLNLERFKRQVQYCLLPNGTCTDLALQSKGRYSDTTPFDFMARMGIWFENFALPVVINECLLQSYNGTLRLVPTWPSKWRAEYRTLRAAGAFLVSAAFDRGEVQWAEIQSEAGMPLRVFPPWKIGAQVNSTIGKRMSIKGLLEVDTSAGEVIRLTPGS